MIDQLEVEEIILKDETPRTIIKSPKFKPSFTVSKSNNGFGFYDVSISKGPVPQELRGQYTRMSSGVRHVTDYIRRAKISKTVQRDRTYAQNHPDKVDDISGATASSGRN